MQPYVRFGSKADICAAQNHVRFTPNSDRKSGPSNVLIFRWWMSRNLRRQHRIL